MPSTVKIMILMTNGYTLESIYDAETASYQLSTFKLFVFYYTIQTLTKTNTFTDTVHVASYLTEELFRTSNS